MSVSYSEVLTDDSKFIVKESKPVNLFFGFFFIVLTSVILYHILVDFHRDQIIIYKKLLYLSLLPAIFFVWKGVRNTILFTIDKTGIYRCSVLITNWDNFIKADITEKPITGSYYDNFILSVEFYKDGKEGYYCRQMKLPNTRNKSEKEIIAAIRYFSKFSKNYTL